MSNSITKLTDLTDGLSKGGVKITNQSKVDAEIKHVKLFVSTFSKIGIKNAKIENSSFTQSIFENVYGRKAEFVNVDFTGTTFTNCNFEKAKFSSCNFRYCNFYNTELPIKEILDCLPNEPNLKNDLARKLKVNYAQLGRKKESDIFLGVEILSHEKEMWAIFTSKTKYYKQNYDVLDRIKFFFKYIISKTIGFVYGHGFNIIKLFSSYAIFIILLAVITSLFEFEFIKIYPPQTNVTTITLNFKESLFLIFGEAIKYSFLEVRPTSSGSTAILLVGRFLGLLYLGLLSATIYRRIAR